MKYNHSCSPGLNAREERRRQAPSSFPLSFRTPPLHSEGKGKSGALSPTGSQYGANTVYRIRVPSPGTASSTGGSDDDQGDYTGRYNGVPIQGGNRGGYQSDGASRVGQPQHMTGLPISIMDGHMGASNCNDRGLTDPNHDVTSYLNCLMQSSCDLPSPSISDPTTPIYSIQTGSHSSGYSNYSYFPLDAGQNHPPSRPRSPTSRTLHTRFTQFWAHLNPFGIVCPESPKFVNTVHTIFTHYVPLYAEEDDMVNHALMAFSAADASINAGGEWGRKLNIAGWKHAGRCQRMLGVRLGKLRLGSTQREVTDSLAVDPEITAVRLGILLMLFYGLFIGDASLLRLTSQLLTLYKTIPTHPSSSNINSPTAIPIVSHYTDLPNGGYRVHLTLDNSHEDEEMGLVVDHGTQVFAQIRSEYESQIAPEILWGAALHEEDDDDDGEEEEEEEQDENVSGMGLGARIRNEDGQRTVRRTKQHSGLLHLSTNLGTAHSGIVITPTSATTLTAVVNFAEFGDAPFPPSTEAYRELVPVSASHTHSFSQSHAQLHHLPHLAGENPNSATPPFILEATGYPRASPHMSSALSTYSTTAAISPPIPLTSQIPADGTESSLRHMQRHMHQNMDI